MMKSRRLLAGLALALAACDSTNPSRDPGTIDGVRVDQVEPAALVAAHFEAWTKRSAAAYDALLEKPSPGQRAPGFRFHVRDDDVEEFPWLEWPFWEHDFEMDVVENMMDRSFAGEEQPVDTIEAEYATLGETPLGPGRQRTTVDAVIRILIGPDQGWIVDTRLEILMAQQADGFWRIREIREMERVRRGRVRASPEPIDSASLGRVKAMYRSPGVTPGIPVDHTEPADLVRAHFAAWSQRDASAYDALLEKPVPGIDGTGFRFYVPGADAAEFPWLADDFWPYGVEADIAGHMMDDGFQGGELPVQSIEANYWILNVVQLGEGHAVTNVGATIVVLVGPDSGWLTDTRFEIETVSQSDGTLRIHRISEIEAIARDRLAAEAASFAQIKALYR